MRSLALRVLRYAGRVLGKLTELFSQVTGWGVRLARWAFVFFLVLPLIWLVIVIVVRIPLYLRARWHELWWPVGLLALFAVFRKDLRKFNLHETTDLREYEARDTDPSERDALIAKGYGDHVPPSYQPNYRSWRSPDGTYNNLTCPREGAAYTRFGRNAPFEHWSATNLEQPSPREVSRRLMSRDNGFKPATSLNLLAAAWIQFQVHDWMNHKANDQSLHEIKLEEGDSWNAKKVMTIKHTLKDPTRLEHAGAPPTFLNTETHWWDGSQLYGSTLKRQMLLRFRRHGKLKMPNGRLPEEKHQRDETKVLDLTGFNDNWWVGLSLLHTLFAREHNVICDRLHAEYPAWDDERLFNTARLINTALMAKIHTVEWTPGILGHPALQVAMRGQWWGILGERVKKGFGRLSSSEVISGIPGSPRNNHGVIHSMTEEFVSVYRLHPLIPDDFNFHSLKKGRFAYETKGLVDVQGEHTRPLMDKIPIEDLFYSFGVEHPGAITLHNFPRALQNFTRIGGFQLDVAAVDIFRDRERGVPRYNDFREMLGMSRIRSFSELTTNPRWAQEIKEVYNNDIDSVDLMVGLFAEPFPKGFGFSDTAFRIFILMASRRLNGDRFFTDDFNADTYTRLGMDWIQQNDMCTILLRHYPDLGPALAGVKNAFAPWNPVEKPERTTEKPRRDSKTDADPTDRSLWGDTRWAFKKWLWDTIVILKFRFKRPTKITPPEYAYTVNRVPLAKRQPKIPLHNVMVAESIPRDENSWIKRAIYSGQVFLYMIRGVRPVQHRRPQIDADPYKALEYALRRHRKYFEQPAMPRVFQCEGPPDLGLLAVQSPYHGYLTRANSSTGQWEWDLRDLDEYPHHYGLRALGVRVKFKSVIDEAGTATLEAYEIESELGTTRPTDSDWELATKIGLCAVSNHTSLVRHFCWVHLAGGAQIAMATRNAFSTGHPILRLLWPHIYGTQCSNYIVTKGQMLEGGDFVHTFSFTHDGMLRLFDDFYPKFRLSMNDPVKDAEFRGITDAPFDTPSQKNTEELFAVMHRHTQRYIRLYYSNHDELQRDAEVRQWLRQLNAFIPGGIGDYVTDVNAPKIEEIARLAASFVYLATVQHEQLGTGLWNYQLWVHKQPVCVYEDGSREPLDVYQRLVNGNFTLNVFRKSLMDDYSYLAMDNDGKREFCQFRHELQVLNRQMEATGIDTWKILPAKLEANINT